MMVLTIIMILQLRQLAPWSLLIEMRVKKASNVLMSSTPLQTLIELNCIIWHRDCQADYLVFIARSMAKYLRCQTCTWKLRSGITNGYQKWKHIRWYRRNNLWKNGDMIILKAIRKVAIFFNNLALLIYLMNLICCIVLIINPTLILILHVASQHICVF
jgi:hypothetical protein